MIFDRVSYLNGFDRVIVGLSNAKTSYCRSPPAKEALKRFFSHHEHADQGSCRRYKFNSKPHLKKQWRQLDGSFSCSSSCFSSLVPAGSSSPAGVPSSRASHHHLFPRITPLPIIVGHHRISQDKPASSAGPSQDYSLSEAQAVEPTRRLLVLVNEEVSIPMAHGMRE